MSNRSWRIAGKLIKYFALTVVFSVCAIVLWRVFSSGDPSSMKTLMVSDATYDAYVAGGESLEMYYQESQLDMTRAEYNAGYFRVSQVAIIPGADQIQLVFRYNNSTLRYIERDLGLSESQTLSRDEDLFEISIVKNTDLTPDNKEDNAYNATDYPEAVKAERYYPSEVISERKNVYNYRKYIFEGITVDELTLALFVDIYYKGEDKNGNPVVPDYEIGTVGSGTLCIYDYNSEKVKRTLTSADKAALEEFGKKRGN